MDLNDLISSKAIVPSLKANSKKQALQELAAKAATVTGLPERDIFDTLLQREQSLRSVSYRSKAPAVRVLLCHGSCARDRS